MKKYIILSLLCISLASIFFDDIFFSTNKEISSYNWHLESIADSTGKLLASDVKKNNTSQQCKMMLNFTHSKFTLTDITDKKEYVGTYSLEKAGDSYKIDMLTDDSNTKITGVYGTRFGFDKKMQPTITLQTKDKILSFVADSK